MAKDASWIGVRIHQLESGRFTSELVWIWEGTERVREVPGDFETAEEAEKAAYRVGNDRLS